VLKILQHDKIWGDNPPLQILGGLVPPPLPPRDLRPCSEVPNLRVGLLHSLLSDLDSSRNWVDWGWESTPLNSY